MGGHAWSLFVWAVLGPTGCVASDPAGPGVGRDDGPLLQAPARPRPAPNGGCPTVDANMNGQPDYRPSDPGQGGSILCPYQPFVEGIDWDAVCVPVEEGFGLRCRATCEVTTGQLAISQEHPGKCLVWLPDGIPDGLTPKYGYVSGCDPENHPVWTSEELYYGDGFFDTEERCLEVASWFNCAARYGNIDGVCIEVFLHEPVYIELPGGGEPPDGVCCLPEAV